MQLRILSKTVKIALLLEMQGKNLIMAYDFEHEGMTDSTFSDKVKSWVFEDLEIDFSGIDLE